MRRIRLAIADDQRLFVDGLQQILSSFEEVEGGELIITAENGKELIDKISESQSLPHVILMDLKMPVMDGLEATREIKKKYPEIKILLLTMYDDVSLITMMMDEGANGYLLKNEDATVLREAINAVVVKDFYFNDYVSKALLLSRKSKKTEPAKYSSYKGNISPRELDVLKLICEEYTTLEIAEKLFITDRTVEGHRRKLLDKTDSKNVAGLVIFACKNGLVDFQNDSRSNPRETNTAWPTGASGSKSG